MWNPLLSISLLCFAQLFNAVVEAFEEDYIIYTVAGTGSSGFSGDNGPATSAKVNGPTDVWVDSAYSAFYFIDKANARVRKVVSSSGIIETIIGTGGFGADGDNGPGTSADLFEPCAIWGDTGGNIFVGDKGSIYHSVRKLDSSGIITRFAGTGVGTTGGDGGPATSATLYEPCAIWGDTTGNMFIAEDGGQVIRKVTAGTGIISSYAGSGSGGFTDNVIGTNARFNSISRIWGDSNGNIFAADRYNYRIRKVAATNTMVTTVIGSGGSSFSGDDGPALSAGFSTPISLWGDTEGQMFIVGQWSRRVRAVDTSGIIDTIAGDGGSSYGSDNVAATSTALGSPTAIYGSASGTLVLVTGNRLCALVPTSVPVTFVPTVVPSSPPTRGPTRSPSHYPTRLPSHYPTRSPSAVPSLLPTTASPTIVPSDYVVTTIAGTGTDAFSGDDGQATDAELKFPRSVWIDSAGETLYFTDSNNRRVRAVSMATGIIDTVVGTGTMGDTGDGGPGTSATLSTPCIVWGDTSGNVFIGDCGNDLVRKRDSSGIITLFAGSGNLYVDDVAATNTSLGQPIGLWGNTVGNLFISDGDSRNIRMVAHSTGIITTYAGVGAPGYLDGPVLSASFVNPRGLWGDTIGNIFVADQARRLRKISFDGMVTTLIGDSGLGFEGDGGPASSALVSSIRDVWGDSNGALFIVDMDNNRIRRVGTDGIIDTVAVAMVGAQGIYGDASGVIYVADSSANLVKALLPNIPTVSPSSAPSLTRTSLPTAVPTAMPTMVPTLTPSHKPTPSPTASPTDFTSSIIAGIGFADFTGDDGPALAAALDNPRGVWVDNVQSFIYIADSDNQRVRRISTASGIIETFAGTGTAGDEGDGDQATSANLNTPCGIFGDTNGNLFIAESSGNKVRKINSSGIITLFAGTGVSDSTGDGGPATSAAVDDPCAIWGDTNGDIFIGDRGGDRVRVVDSVNQIISTYAGSSNGFRDDVALSAKFTSINCLWGDTMGSLYVCDSPKRVRMISPERVVSTVAGSGTQGFDGDGGPATSAQIKDPTGVWGNALGTLFIADTDNNRIRAVSPTGIITTVASEMAAPVGLFGTPAGSLYVTESGSDRNRVLLLVPTTMPTPAPTALPSFAPSALPSTAPVEYYSYTFAGGDGSLGFSGDNGPAKDALLDSPYDGWIDSAGASLYFADRDNHRIRKITLATGIIETFAGNGDSGSNGNGGPATSARLEKPARIWGDTNGNIYIADGAADRLRKIDSSGIISLFAGNGNQASTGDGGQATSAALYSPGSVWCDSVGNVYFPEKQGDKIRVVASATGIVSTYAGSGNTGFLDGAASSAQFHQPVDIWGDSEGNIFVSDKDNHRIRKISTALIVSTVAGTGSAEFSGDGGQASNAGLNGPLSVWGDSQGRLFIADSFNQRIRVVATDGIINTIAGNGLTVFNGDHIPATNAAVNPPRGAFGDINGNIYVCEFGDTNGRIRLLLPLSAVTHDPTLSPSSFPTAIPSIVPTAAPTTAGPSTVPSYIPTAIPTALPSASPTEIPGKYFHSCCFKFTD